MLPRERSHSSAIVDRPALKLPIKRVSYSGASSILKSGTSANRWRARCWRRLTGVTHLPDVPNWSWHEYGMRVGVWRFFDLFKRQNIKPTLAINARVCEDYSRVAETSKKRRLGIHGPFLPAGPDSSGAEPEGDDQAFARRDRALSRQTAGWLAWPGVDADAGDAGPARRGRHQIYRRLGLRRRADDDPHREWSSGDAALYDGAQRHSHDGGAAPRGRVPDQARDRSVRPALCGRRKSAPRSWRWRSIPI